MHLVHSPKIDSYSSLHLVVALALRTLLLQPAWNQQVYDAWYDSYQRISTYMPPTDWMTGPFYRYGIQDTPAGRYAAIISRRIATPYFVATVAIYIIDGLTQWPKRWSFLTPNCWVLGVGVLALRALMAKLERVAGDEWQSGEESPRDPDDTDFTERTHQATLYNLGVRHCFAALAAMIIVCATSDLIDIDGSSLTHQGGWSWNAITALYMPAVTICWALPWVQQHAGAGGKSTYTEVGSPGTAEDGGHMKRGAGWWRVLLVAAAVPLLVGTTKHVVSGTTLGAVYDRMNLSVSIRSRGSVLPHLTLLAGF